MKRRAFLKAAAGLTVAAALPALPKAILPTGDGVALFSASHDFALADYSSSVWWYIGADGRPVIIDQTELYEPPGFSEASLEEVCIEMANGPRWRL